MTDQKKYLAKDLVERKAQFLDQNICPHCDHAEVSKQGNNVFVTDKNSLNGTFVFKP